MIIIKLHNDYLCVTISLDNADKEAYTWMNIKTT